MFKSRHPIVLAFLVRAVNGFVGEVADINEAGVEALEIGDHSIEVHPRFRREGEGSLNRPLGFIPPQLSRGRN